MTEVAKPIGRDAVQQQLRQHLTGKGVVLAAINGLPGVGKTTLAVELAHNEEIRRHFTEGVLWAGLGPAPDMFALLSHWCTYARLDLACPLHFHHLLQPSSTMFYPELYR